MSLSVREVVDLIHSKSTLEDVIRDCLAPARSLGLKRQWVISVFNSHYTLPVLDLSVDVHEEGVSVLSSMGVSAEIQAKMWEKWGIIDDDIKATWVDGWTHVDSTDIQDVVSYAMLLVNYLSSP